MLAEELIVENIPPLKSQDTGELALQWMDDYKVSHLCVLNKGKYLGILSESDVLSIPNLEDAIGKHRDLLNPVYVTRSQHIFEVVKVVNDHKLSIIPVLDSDDNYCGSITIGQLMEIIADMPVANNIGAIIELELNINDYSLSPIAAIIEENGTKILGTFITSHADSTKMQLTIKVNRTEIKSILASLLRHEYVAKVFNGNEGSDDDLRDRFDSLMNYLNV